MTFYAGHDLAKTRDYTALTIGEVQGGLIEIKESVQLPHSDYSLVVKEVVRNLVQGAIDNPETIEAVKDLLDGFNKAGCSIDGKD